MDKNKIKNMSYYEVQNILNKDNVNEVEKQILKRKLRELNYIKSSYEQYVNDFNMVKNIANKYRKNKDIVSSLNVYLSAYKEFGYTEFLYYIGYIYYLLHDRKNSCEYLLRYINLGGYVHLDRAYYYLAINNLKDISIGKSYYYLALKYSSFYGLKLYDCRFHSKIKK